MARKNPYPRRRGALGAVGVTLSACVAAGIFLAAGAPADERESRPSERSDPVIVCESGTVTRDGVETSSAVAARLPEGTPLLPGCRDG